MELSQAIEKRYEEYLTKIKEWSEDIPTGRIGKCDLCTKSKELTQHHLIPKRVFKDNPNTSLMSFLQKFTVEICTECHNKFHPENIWKADLLEFQKISEAEVKKAEREMKKRIEESEKVVAEYKQKSNNVENRNQDLKRVILGKEEGIKNLKKEIAELNTKIKEKETQLSEKETSIREGKGSLDIAHIIYNILEIHSDEENYKKEMREEIKRSLEEDRDSLMSRKGPVQPRDIDFLVKRIQMRPLVLKAIDNKILQEFQETLQRIHAEETHAAMAEVFEVPKEMIRIVDKKKDGKTNYKISSSAEGEESSETPSG